MRERRQIVRTRTSNTITTSLLSHIQPHSTSQYVCVVSELGRSMLDSAVGDPNTSRLHVEVQGRHGHASRDHLREADRVPGSIRGI
jgi:hypothetical protein